MEEKQSKYISGFTAVSKVPVFEDKSALVRPLMFRILSLKKECIPHPPHSHFWTPLLLDDVHHTTPATAFPQLVAA